MTQTTYSEALQTIVPRYILSQLSIVGVVGYFSTPKYVFKIALHNKSGLKTDGFPSVKVSVIHKDHGEIDNVVLDFPKYLNSNKHTLTKCVCTQLACPQQVYWDEELTDTEVETIQENIRQYIKLWREGDN
jgi:hypothetical protein